MLNIAHRGASDRAPEHTLAALDLAVADHADRLSIDVRLTRDGVPVVLHDDSLERTTDVRRAFPRARSFSVRDFTYAQVRTLDAGGWFGDGTFAGSRVLTLDQLLTELGPSPVGLVVEAKSPQDADGVEGIGSAIMAAVARHPAWARRTADGSPRLVVESYRWTFLDHLHEAYPRQPLVLLGEDVTPADLVAHPYVHEIDVGQAHLTPELVADAHGRGVAVGVFTVNGRPGIRGVVAAGADGVTSDEPATVRSVLRLVDRLWSGVLRPRPPVVRRVGVRVSGTVRAGARVAVRLRLRDASGAAVPWTRVRLQSRVRGTWRVVARRATGAHGTADVSLPPAARGTGLRLRAVSSGVTSAVAAPVVGRP